MRDALQRDLEARLEGEVRFDKISRALYSTDASVYEIEPLGVVIVRSRDDILGAITCARRHACSITARGGGTSQAGQAIGEGLQLDTSKYFNRLLEVNVDERWARVEPGIVLDELNAQLAPHGLRFAPDISTASRATIGGMISNNSSGARSVLYGKTIDHVLDLHLSLADGTVAHLRPLEGEALGAVMAADTLEGLCYRTVRRLGTELAAEIDSRYPKILRRVGGYNLDAFVDTANGCNLAKLVVGAEGTLGIVVEARLKLVPLPTAKAVLTIEFDELLDALAATPAILEHGPSAVEVMDRHILDHARENPALDEIRRAVLRGDPGALLCVEFYADDPAELPDKLDALERDLATRAPGAHTARATAPADQARIWRLREASLGLSMAIKGDASALVVRVLGEQVGRVLDATASPSAVAPFISPDSEWVGFYDIRARTLGRISIHGGSATSIGTLPSRGQLVGASWGADDTIIFGTRQPNGLWRIPVSGGEAEAVTTTEGTENHVWPEVLPGGRTVLFTIQIGNDLAGARVAVLDLETGTQEVLISGGHAAQYVSSGHLVYASGNTLWAVGFDPTSLTITTDPIPVLDDVLVKPFGVASFSVSDTGSLVAVSGSVVGDSNQLVWVDRAGVETFLFEDSNTRSFRNPRISPDGQQVSVVVNERPTVFGGWFLDLRRGVLQRLGVSGDASLPVLSPSGDQAVFARQEAGEVRNLFRLFMDGSAVPERLTTSEHLQIPTSWTPDGASLVFVQSTAASDNDIWVLPMDGDGEQWMFRGTESDETQAMLSPDGNWIAYRSDASGRDEIYVEPFPDGGLPRLVSSGGGTEPVWARDMSELFYRNGTSVMAVSLVVGSGLIAGVPMQLFDGPYELTALRYSNYDVDLDGSRFVMVKPGSRGTSSAQTRVNLTLNWHQELLERVPIN